MGRVIRELTHTYSLTHKDYKKKKDEAFCGVFPRERERGGRGEREFWDSTQRFRSSTVVDLIATTLLYIQICWLHKVSSCSFKSVWKTPNLCTKHYPRECVKTCSGVCIYILKIYQNPRSNGWEKSENSYVHESQSVKISAEKISETFSTLIFSYFLESSIV